MITIKAKIIILIFILARIICPLSVIGQSPYNLVPNWSFEYDSICTNYSQYVLPYPWFVPTTATGAGNMAGCFSGCSSNSCCGVPINVSFQYPKTGNSYANEFFIHHFGQNNYRGYIQAPLKDSLLAGKCYYAEFFINLLDNASLAVNNVSMLLSKTAVSQGNTYNPIIANASIQRYGNPILPPNTLNWLKVSGIYIAQGGEKFITIGNFQTDLNTDTAFTNFPGAYRDAQYNIDDVSVIPISLDSFYLKADAGLDTTITIGDSVFIGTLLGGTINTTWYNSSGSVVATNVPGLYVSPTQNTYYVLEQSMCTYTSRDTVYVSVQSLPLKLLTFTAKWLSSSPSTEEPVLQWTTAQELNTSHFEIERSFNGREFSKIGIVKANSTTQLNTYKFSDAVAPNSPLWGGGGAFLSPQNGGQRRAIYLQPHPSTIH